MQTIDYDSIAEIYDIYVTTDFDFLFYKNHIKFEHTKILELTSGTGRLSIPLIESGANLTCVDISSNMLNVLERKLQSKRLSAKVVCKNIFDITYKEEFDYVIIPFQSFMEFVGSENQSKVLNSVNEALVDSGIFICTMHNPDVRRKNVDGQLHIVGNYATEDGNLIVSGFEKDGNPVVKRYQFFEKYNKQGYLEAKRLLEMQFELIYENNFRKMAESAGFRIISLYGNYDESEFNEKSSPVMIWVLEKAK